MFKTIEMIALLGLYWFFCIWFVVGIILDEDIKGDTWMKIIMITFSMIAVPMMLGMYFNSNDSKDGNTQ